MATKQTSTITGKKNTHCIWYIPIIIFALFIFNTLIASPAIIFIPAFGQSLVINFIDTVPPKRLPTKLRPSINKKSKQQALRKTIPTVIVKGKPLVMDSSELAYKEFASMDHIGMAWNLADTGTTKMLGADSIRNTFLNYINRIYHLGNISGNAQQLTGGALNGRVKILAIKDNASDTDDKSMGQKGALQNAVTVPYWNGTLHVDSTFFTVNALGSRYTVDTQKIVVHYPNMVLNSFTVQDAAHNKLVANGGIVAKSGGNNNLKMGLSTKNFTLFNVQKAIANQVYGFAAVDASATITGSTANPIIEGNILLNDSSDITIILPQNNVNKDAQNSMIRFIKSDTFILPQPKERPFIQTLQPNTSAVVHQRLQYKFNIQTSPHAAISFIIDPSAGDELKLYGKAKLKAGFDSAGGLILQGLYNLDSGYYRLNYQFLKRQFTVVAGSRIIFAGTPTDAQVNITAEYIIRTAAWDLLGNEVGEVTPRIEKTFNQKIPFRVLLQLTGPIRKPLINFKIEMISDSIEMNHTLRVAIQNKLVQLKENFAATNKQVFSLLLYNRFVGEQSEDFFKGSGNGDGGGFDDLSHESVSKFLSSALDNIAADLFKTLDVGHDIDNYRDYGNGDAQQKAEIKMDATKSFVNDRLSIDVGKNYGIDGQDASAKAAQQKGVGFLPDVTLNYKFTKDGKYRYKLYKKNQFEVVVDGYVTESGISLVWIMDYDKFSNLLNRQSKKGD